MSAKTVTCPICGGLATITVFEQLDSLEGACSRSIEFHCDRGAHRPDEPELHELWAADHALTD